MNTQSYPSRDVRARNLLFLRNEVEMRRVLLIQSSIAFRRNGVVLVSKVLSEIISSAWSAPLEGTDPFQRGSVSVEQEDFFWELLYQSMPGKLYGMAPCSDSQVERVLAVLQ